MKGSGRGSWLLCGILAATVVLHWRALGAPFFTDDYLFLEQVRGQSLGQALSSPDPLGNFLRPVSRQLYFWLVAHLGGERPAVFHGVNLALFLALIAVLFHFTRKLAGTGIATFAAAFVAFHYAADVPLVWVSGSQDLLAALAAVTAIHLHRNGLRAWSAAALGVGLLSKEHVVVVPLIAVLAESPPGRAWRPAAMRAWPLFLVTAVWAAVWLATASGRPAAAAAMHADPSAVPAALWHLLQVSGGLEAGPLRIAGARWGIIAITLAMAAIAVWLAAPRGRSKDDRTPSDPSMPPGRALAFGAAWAVLGALPIAAVAPIWSAYFYLFALCGTAIALGGLVQRWPPWARVGAIVALGIGSVHGRQLQGFATGTSAWSGQSHVNAFYLRRAMGTSARFVREMKAARPSLPPRSTVFFADLPPSVGLQTADGPVLRFAYGDRTLRSYYLTEFTRDMSTRGPLFFFAVEDDALRDHTDDPTMLASAAYSMMLGERPAAATPVLELALRRAPDDRALRYWLAWTQWAAGDSALAVRSLALAGTTPGIGPAPELERALRPVSHDDTARAIAGLLRARNRVGLSPDVHARLAALCLASAEHRQLGVIEAFVYTRLRPRDSDAWRKWASAQLAEHRYEAAARSLKRYFELGGAAAQEDMEARNVMASLHRVLPGGDIAQRAVSGGEARSTTRARLDATR